LEPQRFDELSKSAANGISRRQICALLASGLGGLGVLFGCGGPPDGPRSDPTNRPKISAPQGSTCGDQGLADCSNGCVDLRTDPANCGTCGRRCQSGVCNGGRCLRPAPVCQGSLIDCGGGVCADLQFDPANCGTCGRRCQSGICNGGACQEPPELTCADQGLADCGNGCVDLRTDPDNCGGCGFVCRGGASCLGGECQEPRGPTCSEQGMTDCGNGCVNVGTDPDNCGTCGKVCPLPRHTCEASVCAPNLRDLCLDTYCGSDCVDLQTDPANCGTCGNVCLGQVRMECVSGACQPVVNEPILAP
jgi:hypothetical protein